MSYLNTLLFGYYPYVAMSVLSSAAWPAMTDQYAWRTGSSQFLRAKNYAWAVICFTSAYCCCL
jgi:nitrate reductase gamma subunit